MEKFLLEDFAGGAVAERIGSAIQRVYENIANPNMDAEKAISSRMIVESDGRGNVQGNEWRREAMKGQLEIDREEAEKQETSGGVIDLQAQKRKVE